MLPLADENQIIYHLAILIEEIYPRLSEDITYSSPALDYPFVFQSGASSKPLSPQNREIAIGKREYRSLRFECYSFDSLKFPEMSNLKTDSTTDTIEFRSGNPCVETTEGVIHVYRNQKQATLTSTVLCIFSVPSQVAVRDLLDFVSPMRKSIRELRVVTENAPNRYMALLKFHTKEDTDQFYMTYNNACYRTLESEVCQLMYVSHVDVTHSSVGLPFPIKDVRELPSCPVCLERLDEPVQGILTTILCNHTFHDVCISPVETTCPVCRYVQSPELMDDSQCADCCIRENLWICLICGRIGCGRYGQKHAHQHFEETGHTFALELGKNMVWDYADDAYVHRLALNQEDGKLVQLGPGSETGDKKSDLMCMEFSAVLTSQLESQRAYFEQQLERVTSDAVDRTRTLEQKLEEVTTALDNTQKQLLELKKENSGLTRKLRQATTSSDRLKKELEEERLVNQSLVNNQTVLREQMDQKESELKVAREDYENVLLNLEVRSKLDQLTTSGQVTTDEIHMGQLSVQDNQPSRSKRKHRHK